MKYVNFGKTGDKVSVLGFGCGRLPEKEINGKMYPEQDMIDEMISVACNRGINYFDTAPYYCSHQCEQAVGEALKPFRNQVKIGGKAPVDDVYKGKYRGPLEQSLINLQVDYIDYYHFWGIGKSFFENTIIKNGLLKEAYKAKEEGLIKHVAFSFHSDPKEVKEIIDMAEALGYPFDSVLCQYNLLDRSNEKMIEYAHSKGVATVAMGPVGGGRLAVPTNLPKEMLGLDNVATYELALRFVLSNPYMDCTLSGMQNTDMVNENIDIVENNMEIGPDEWDTIKNALERLKKFNEIYCTGCKYCSPCPAGIGIDEIFQFFTYYNVYDLRKAAMEGYEVYISKGRKSVKDCIDCGQCEAKCPQKIKVREKLAYVDKKLRGLI